jgi:hypothetical protein
MIELGERQDEENRNFGRHMAENPPDHVYLVGRKTDPAGLRRSAGRRVS